MDDNRRTELFKLRRLSSLSWYEIAAKFDMSEREVREEFRKENTRQSGALSHLSERFGILGDQLDELFAYNPDREIALYADLDLRSYGSYTVHTVNLSLEYALGAALMGMGELRDVMSGGDMTFDVFPAQLEETLDEEWLPLNVPDLMRVYVRELDERERDEIGIEVAPRTAPSHETARDVVSWYPTLFNASQSELALMDDLAAGGAASRAFVVSHIARDIADEVRAMGGAGRMLDEIQDALGDEERDKFEKFLLKDMDIETETPRIPGDDPR